MSVRLGVRAHGRRTIEVHGNDGADESPSAPGERVTREKSSFAQRQHVVEQDVAADGAGKTRRVAAAGANDEQHSARGGDVGVYTGVLAHRVLLGDVHAAGHGGEEAGFACTPPDGAAQRCSRGLDVVVVGKKEADHGRVVEGEVRALEGAAVGVGEEVSKLPQRFAPRLHQLLHAGAEVEPILGHVVERACRPRCHGGRSAEQFHRRRQFRRRVACRPDTRRM